MTNKMILENRLNITDSAELACDEERISKKKAVQLFDNKLLGIQSIKWTSKITQTGDFQLDWEITRDYENGDGEDYKKIIGALNEEVNPPWGKIARIVV